MVFLFIPDPDFVSSLEDEDHVYFFFRESAVEYINCGKVSLYPSRSSVEGVESFPVYITVPSLQLGIT